MRAKSACGRFDECTTFVSWLAQELSDEYRKPGVYCVIEFTAPFCRVSTAYASTCAAPEAAA